MLLPKRILLLLTIVLFYSTSLYAQRDGYEVFIPISKYISQGDADKISAWYADNLEISIFSTSSVSSRNQARQILKSFFESHTPRSFDITHMASRGNMKYAHGTLVAGGERIAVTIFVSLSGDSYKIQQLKIDRLE